MIALAVVVLAGIGQLFNDDDSAVTPIQKPTTSAPVTKTDQVEATPSATIEESPETSPGPKLHPQRPSRKAIHGLHLQTSIGTVGTTTVPWLSETHPSRMG